MVEDEVHTPSNDTGNDRTQDRVSFAEGGVSQQPPHKDDLASVVIDEKEQHLPTIIDSKTWKVRCLRGMERQLVAQLLLKAIDYFNLEKPFMILTIFNCDKSPGHIYVEAYNKNHVLTFIDGISGLNHRSVEMIPQSEVPQVLKSCIEVSESALQVHQWVRIRSGVYAGDLGLVEHIEGGPGGPQASSRALVRVIPRMQEVKGENGKTHFELVTKKDPKFNALIRPQQRYFNPSLAKEDCQKEKH